MSAPSAGEDAVHDVWVRIEPAGDVKYVAVIELGDDLAIKLDRDLAEDWAQGVLEQVQRAMYAAAAVRQVTELTSHDVAMRVRGRLSAEWPQPSGWCRPLDLTPELSQSGEPFLSVYIGATHVGRWSIAEARAHAVAVLEAVIVADLSEGYRRSLFDVLGIGDGSARSIVGGVTGYAWGRHRPVGSS